MLIEVFLVTVILTNLHEVSIAKRLSRTTTSGPDYENVIHLKPEDVNRIKTFLQTIDRFDDESSRLKDPSAYCRSFHNCHECVKSMWYPCGWCHNVGCSENPEKQCPFAVKKAEKSNITGEIKACPQLQHDGPILIPAGVHMNIKVKIYVPDPIIYEKEIICLVKLKQKLTHLKGLIVSDTVYCFQMLLKSDQLEFGDTQTGTLRVIWGGAQPYSNEVPLIVYTCETLAIDCEACRLIPAAYGCGWCDITQSCVIGEKCANDLMKWTLNRLTCEPYGKKLYYI